MSANPAFPWQLATPPDPHFAAFVDPRGPEVFTSVAFGPDIWKPDPCDVEAIHAEAREAFARQLNRAAGATAGQGHGHGAMLLLLGESGSGKTHLLRAFRQTTHAAGLGYFAYLQLTTNVGNYFRYTLRNVVDSLGQPYGLDAVGGAPLGGGHSGLFRLSDSLAEHPAVPPEWLAALREGPYEEYVHTAWAIADTLLDAPALAQLGLDLNFVRALLILQRREPKITRRVVSYLRGEALTAYDRDFLGGIEARTAEDDPRELLGQFARAAQVGGGAFVVCFDQLEYLYESGEAGAERFRRAVQAAQMLADANPASLVVIACLEDYYGMLRNALAQSSIDRLEQDPPPVRLEGKCGAEEVAQLVGRRLEHLFGSLEVTATSPSAVHPFDPADLARLAGQRTRDVLHACQQARERSRRDGQPPRAVIAATSPPGASTPAPSPATGESTGAVPPTTPDDGSGATEISEEIVRTEQAWNDFRATSTAAAPEDDAALADLLAWAINGAGEEIGLGANLRARSLHAYVEVDAAPPLGRLLVGMCHKGAAGGALGRQIAALVNVARTAGRAPAAVRATAFPGKAGSVIARQLGELIAKERGRRAVVEDNEWRTLAALREFLRREEMARRPGLDAWRRAEKPLARLPGLRELLRLEELPPPAPPATGPDAGPPVAPPPTDPSPDGTKDPTLPDPLPDGPGTPVVLGRTREVAPRPVTLDPAELTRHAAFLGGSGSGKTTLALGLVEALLLRGIPVVLLDRKGDLCRYADPAAWEESSSAADPDQTTRAQRRAQLRERLDVQVFTPGSGPLGRGRPLAISLLPRGAGALPGTEREAVARQAAFALGAMMGYRTTGVDGARLAMLGKAVATLAEVEPAREPDLDRLIDFIAAEDETLVNAIGHFEPKHFKRLKQDLATFRYNHGHLLAANTPLGGEQVEAGRLLGLGAHAVPGRTRLTVISTKFLGDTANALFWIAQLLLELSRHAARHPAAHLQAAVLFDEADLYLPAVGRPATKEPMEHALRRWRSAGLGMLLATQSPGDFDYKCRDNVRTWFAGRVKETVALHKMQPMLAEAKVDIAAKLPGLHAGEFFVLRDGTGESLLAHRALVAPEQLADEDILRLAERTAVTVTTPM